MEQNIGIFTDESIRLAVALDGWVLDIARDKWAENEKMTMDEIIKVNNEFISKHWHLNNHEITSSDLQTIKRKVCELFGISDRFSKVALDWSFDDDKNHRYKLNVKEHPFKPGMRILLSVWGIIGEEQTAIISKVLSDGIIIQADGYIDISEEYTIKIL